MAGIVVGSGVFKKIVPLAQKGLTLEEIAEINEVSFDYVRELHQLLNEH